MESKTTYRFETPAYPGNILYVNPIGRYSCTNDCLFCSRPRNKGEVGKPNIYEKKAGSSLFLPQSPSVKQMVDEIHEKIRPDDKEVAIIGLGEPLIYLPKVAEVLRRIKNAFGIKTRVDTNGLVKCMYKNPTQLLEDSRLDEIRISLNATNEEYYNRLCRPRFKNAFPNLTSFVRECANSRINTLTSFLTGFEAEGLQERTEEELAQFAISLE
jgi:TatD family-associated radical SAM protein